MVRALLGIRVFVLGQAAVALAAGSLSRSDNPPLDAVLRAVMIAQAQAKHEQMRSYVDGTGGGAPGRGRDRRGPPPAPRVFPRSPGGGRPGTPPAGQMPE